MSLLVAALLVAVGLALVLAFAGRLVRGVVGTSAGFGISAFLISVVFVGFDPENLAVGAAGAWEDVAGIALGSIIGAAMVALALAFGITALLAPMTFEDVAKPVLVVPIAAVALFGGVALDGTVGRVDGIVLLGGYALAVGYLLWLGRRGVDIESATKPRRPNGDSRWRAAGLMLLSLVAIVAGSELVITGSETIIERFGLTDTFYGMAILALLVSIEEVARELPAARRGHPEITFGNVVGSTLAFFLFNGGIIALVRPIELTAPILRFYLPVAAVTVVVIAIFMWRKAMPRWAGAVLVVLYAIFVVGGYLVSQTDALAMFG